MGSLLQQKGIARHPQLWMSFANITSPETVQNIHQKYIDAGADIITTNTFRTNPASVTKSKIDYSIEKLISVSVKLAKEIKIDREFFIAGSNAPAEDCYQRERKLSKKELEKNHQTHIDLLFANGVDFILNETQSHFDEIEIICKHCSTNKIPYIISLFFNDKFELLSGEKLIDTISFINNFEPIAIGLNCIHPEIFVAAVKKKYFSTYWGFYLNCGSGHYSDENISCGLSPEKYVKVVQESINKKTLFVGACCGSSYSHIKKLKEFFDGKNNNKITR